MRGHSLWLRSRAVPATTLLLFAATAVSRLPFTSRTLYAWDSANFALALQQYNVVFHQPHPPGYPLYVGMAKLLDLWIHDANTSLVAISIIASAGAVALLFPLASRMYGAWVGFASAILLGASVGFWGYGEVAYPYTCLAFFGVLLAWLCYLMWQGCGWLPVLSGLALAIAAGFRPDILLFLGPLWLASIWRFGLRRTLLSALVLGLGIASWLLPAAWMSGGLGAYLQANSAQSDYILSTYSVFFAGLQGLRNNTETLLLFVKQMFGLTLVVTVYFSGRFLTFKALVADRRLLFLVLWLTPPLLVYLLVHIGDPGYILSLLPALCIVTAVGIRDIVNDLASALVLIAARYRRLGRLAGMAGRHMAVVAALMVLALVAWNTNAFLETPGPARLPEIRTIDAIVTAQTGYIRQFRPESVVVLAKARFRQFKYYLPEYNIRLLYDEYQNGYTEVTNSYKIPEGVNTVLVMDFGKRPASLPERSQVTLPGPSGQQITLWRFEVKPGDTIRYGYDFAPR